MIHEKQLPERPLSRLLKLLLIFALYTALTSLITWPAIGRLGTEIPDVLGDGYVHLWTFNWLKEALLTGSDPYFTSKLFFPVGASLTNHNIAWFHFLLWLPVQTILSGPAAFSLVFLLNYPLNALTTFLLARRLTQSDTAAFISGMVAGFWPYNISHHSHPNLISIWWIPLILMALEDLFLRQRYRNAVIVGLLVGLLGVTRWQLLILSSILLAMAFISHFVHRPRTEWLHILLLSLVSGLIALAVMSPFLVPVLQQQATRANPEDLLLDDEEAYGTDLLAYLLPSRYHPLWGQSVMKVVDGFAGNAIYVRYIGFVPLILAILGSVTRWRKSRFWLISAVVYLILSLGSPLYVLGKPLWTMPYEVLEGNFAFQLIRFPDRFNVILAIPVAMLVGFGVEWLRSRLKPLPANAMAVLIGGLIVVEYIVVYPMLPLTVPHWYERLKGSGATIGLLDIPMCSQAEFNKRYMYYQLDHGLPLVQGHISRPSREMFAFIDTVPLLKEIDCKFDPPVLVHNVSEQLRILAAANVPYLILHKEYLKADQLESWRQWMAIPPSYEDSELVVYETARKSSDTTDWLKAMMVDQSGQPTLGLVESGEIISSLVLRQGDWLVTDMTWQATSPPGELLACLELASQKGETGQSDCYPLSDDWPVTEWQEGEIVHEDYPLQLDPFLAPGEYQVSLSLRDGLNQQPVGQEANLGVVTVESLPRQFAPPAEGSSEMADWLGQIALVGYDVIEGTHSLQVALHLRAEERMNDSYKLFLHVVDPGSGELIAQEDRIPGNWTYPTNWWEAGEYVTEVIDLPLDGALSKESQIWIGWYDPDRGERLPVYASESSRVDSDSRFLLVR